MSKVSIYDKKTGKKVIELSHPVDIKEWLSTGKYVDKKPVRKAPTPPVQPVE